MAYNCSTFEPVSAWKHLREHGCQAARGYLIEHYRYLVRCTRERLVPDLPPDVDPRDLEAHAHRILIRKIDRFRDSGEKFPFYAVPALRGAMLDYLRHRFQKNAARKASQRLKAARRRIEDRGGEATHEALCADLGLDAEGLDELQAAARTPLLISLETETRWQHYGYEDNVTWQEAMVDEEPSPEEQALRAEQRRALARAVARLPLREREAVVAYYQDGTTLGAVLLASGLERMRGMLGKQRGLFE